MYDKKTGVFYGFSLSAMVCYYKYFRSYNSDKATKSVIDDQFEVFVMYIKLNTKYVRKIILSPILSEMRS